MTPSPSWKKYQLLTDITSPTITSRTSVRLPEGPGGADEEKRAAHRPAEERDRQGGEQQDADELEDGHPVGRVAQVDVLAALALRYVAAEGGDDEQQAEETVTAPMT